MDNTLSYDFLDYGTGCKNGDYMNQGKTIGIRQDEMTSAERLGALIDGKPIDRVPITNFGMREFSALNVGYTIADSYCDPEKSVYAQVRTMEQYGFQLEPNLAYASYGAWEFGGEIRMPESEWEAAPVVTRYPVMTPEDVERLEIPEVETAGAFPIMIEFARIQQQFDMPVTVRCFVPFASAGNICGVENLCRWMIKMPDVVYALLGKCLAFHKKAVDYFVKVFAGSPLKGGSGGAIASNQVISPGQFEKFALPYYIESHQYMLDSGVKGIFCHICGEQNLNLPYWKQVPFGDPGTLSFGHEVDLRKAIETFGDRHIIAGNVEPRVIQEGTWQEVYELSRQCIEKAKHAPSGYILMSGCDVPIQAPPFNVYAMKRAVMDFGFYD